MATMDDYASSRVTWDSHIDPKPQGFEIKIKLSLLSKTKPMGFITLILFTIKTCWVNYLTDQLAEIFNLSLLTHTGFCPSWPFKIQVCLIVTKFIRFNGDSSQLLNKSRMHTPTMK